MSPEVMVEAWAVLVENMPAVRWAVRRCQGPAMRRAAWSRDIHHTPRYVEEVTDAVLPFVFRSVACWVGKGRPGRVTTYITNAVVNWVRRGNRWADRKQERQAAEYDFARLARSEWRLGSSYDRQEEVRLAVKALPLKYRRPMRKRFGLGDRPPVPWAELSRTERVYSCTAVRMVRDALNPAR